MKQSDENQGCPHCKGSRRVELTLTQGSRRLAVTGAFDCPCSSGNGELVNFTFAPAKAGERDAEREILEAIEHVSDVRSRATMALDVLAGLKATAAAGGK